MIIWYDACQKLIHLQSRCGPGGWRAHPSRLDGWDRLDAPREPGADKARGAGLPDKIYGWPRRALENDRQRDDSTTPVEGYIGRGGSVLVPGMDGELDV